jgi:hypothetical protein
LGLAQPFVWYWIWSALSPGLFGSEYRMLLPAIIATIGVLGGGAIGLIAGAVAPSRVGIAASIFGLGVIHIATGLYFLATPGDTLFAAAALLAPAVVVEFALALAILFLRPIRWRSVSRPGP